MKIKHEIITELTNCLIKSKKVENKDVQCGAKRAIPVLNRSGEIATAHTLQEPLIQSETYITSHILKTVAALRSSNEVK